MADPRENSEEGSRENVSTVVQEADIRNVSVGTPLRALIPWPIYVGVTTFMVWSLLHAVLARPFWDYLRNSLYVWIALMMMLIQGESESRRTRQNYVQPIRTGWENFRSWVGALLALAPVAVVIYSMFVTAADSLGWLIASTFVNRQTISLTASITLCAGIVLFYFRLHMRCIYGATEAIAGVAVAVQRVTIEPTSPAQAPAFYLAILTAGVYLVVRGLDNVHQGWTKEPHDRVAKWVVNKLRLPVTRLRPENARVNPEGVSGKSV